MKSSTIAFVLGAVSALAMGMAAEACSSSSTSNPVGNGDGGSSGNSTGANHSTGSAGSTGSEGVKDAGSDVECFKPPKTIYALDGSTGVYCPFSAPDVDGGKNMNCTTGEHCCEPPESDNALSTCVAGGTACPVKDSTDWECEGTTDCAAKAGTICCGRGTIGTQGAQPACGITETFPYVSGFYGSACQTSCATYLDGGTSNPAFQICSKTSECPVGEGCVAVAPKGNTIGYCTSSGASSVNQGGSSSSSQASTGESSVGSSVGSGSGSSGSASSAHSSVGGG
jgi:hypothetical protein